MSQIEEVVIVGGGPAGAYCAFELSSHGLDPIILDYSFPREKPCGGGILPFVIEKFNFLDNFRTIGSTFEDFKLVSCTDNEVITPSLKNGLCVSRRLFDEKLLDMARKKGAKFSKEKVIDVRCDNGNWKIKTDKSVLSSSMIIRHDCSRKAIPEPGNILMPTLQRVLHA